MRPRAVFDSLESRRLLATLSVSAGQSIQPVLDGASVGDIVRLEAGVHAISAPLNVKAGVTLEGVGSGSTVLTSTTVTGDYLVKLTSGSRTNGNQEVRGIRFDGQSRALRGAVQSLFRDNVRVKNCVFLDFHDNTVNMRGAGYNQVGTNAANRVTGLEFSNNSMSNCGYQSNNENRPGIVMIGMTSGMLVYGNTIDSPTINTHGVKYDWNAGGGTASPSTGWNFGLKVYNNTINVGGGGFTVEMFNAYDGCEVYDNTLNRPVSWGGNKDQTLNGDGVLDVRVHHNRILASNMAVELQTSDAEVDHNYITSSGANAGIAIWNAGDSGNRRNYWIHHNIVDTTGSGMNISGVVIESIGGLSSGQDMNAWVYNNTFVGLDRGVFLHTAGNDQHVRGVRIVNNVFRNSYREGIQIYRQNQQGAFSDISIDSNLTYQGGGSNSLIGYQSLTASAIANHTVANTYTQDPQLALSGPKPTPYYAPAPSSSFVVDKGTSVVPSRATNGFVGTPDLGAYEAASITRNPFSPIEAESADARSGTSSITGAIGSFDSGDWLRYDNVAFGSTGANRFTVRIANGNSGTQSFAVRLGSTTGTTVGTMSVTNTGGWNTYANLTVTLSQTVTGTQTLFLVGTSGTGIGNVDQFTFAYVAPTSLGTFTGTQDIGGVAAAGSASESSGTYTVTGSGYDIDSNNDEFRYLYKTLTGDGQIVARINSQTNTHAWAKAGIMFRDTLGNNAMHASLFLTPSNGSAFQYRSTSGGLNQHVGAGTASAPLWLKLVRSGNVFTAYRSSDGVSWGTAVGTQTIAMSATAYVGLAVSSHLDGTLSTVTFDNVSIGTGALVVSNLADTSAGSYTLHQNLQAGDLVYSDRSYTYTSVASSLLGKQYIRTANNDKVSTTSNLLSFDLNTSATVYVLFDINATSLPAWMSGFTDTGLTVTTSDPTFKVYSRTYAGGTVTLGGGMASGGGGVGTAYTVVIG